MTKKEVCESHKSIAYYSGYWWIEIRHIEYGINDYVYRISNARYPSKWIGYHKSKIFYDGEKGAYIKPWWVYKYYLCDFIRM